MYFIEAEQGRRQTLPILVQIHAFQWLFMCVYRVCVFIDMYSPLVFIIVGLVSSPTYEDVVFLAVARLSWLPSQSLCQSFKNY